MRIGIDMGHTVTGTGTGAGSIYAKETDKNREAGKKLIELLKAGGHNVVDCTVDKSNNDLYDRVQKANAQSLDLFISLHLNAYNVTTAERGVETYHYNTDAKGKEYATRIQKELVSKIKWKDRGVKTASYYVLKNTIAPAVLVELGFCDSKGDMDKWNADLIARALYKAITGQEANNTTPGTVTGNNTATTANTGLYKIDTDVLNIRAGAGTGYKVVGTVKRGEVYTITEVIKADGYNWGRLKSGAGFIALEYCIKR